MSTIFFFIKFFDNPKYAADFIGGKFFCNTLSAFKDLEGRDTSGRADRNEGTTAWLQPDQSVLEINDFKFPPADFAGPIQIQKNWLNHIHLFCIHAAHTGTLDLSNISNENIEDLRHEMLIPDAALTLGEYAVVVKDVTEFIKRMKAAAQAQNYRLAHGRVTYYDPDTFHGQFRDGESVFWKQNQFRHQREFRFALNTGLISDSPLILEIGDISDITMSLRSAELNGETFLGGDMKLPE